MTLTWDLKQTHRHRQQYGRNQRRKGVGGDSKGAQYMAMEDDLTLGGGHTVQYAARVSQKCTPKTYMTLGTNVTPINTIKRKSAKHNK